MKYFLSLLVGCIFFFFLSTTHAAGKLEIFSPNENETLTGGFLLKVIHEIQIENGYIQCDIKKTVTSKRSLFSTGVILDPTHTGGSLFIDPINLKLKNGSYSLLCNSYDLRTNVLLDTDSVRFRFLGPKPVVLFARESGNLIRNPEFLEQRGELPAYWKYGYYGRSNTTQDFLFTGLVSGRSLRATVTDSVSGDVKWYFQDVTAIGGRTYIYAEKYHTTTPAKLIVRYTMKDGKYQYDELQSLPITEGAYASVRVYFIAPKDAIGLTVWTSIATPGSLIIDDPLLLLSPVE